MKINYQGKERETVATTLGELLAEQGVDAAHAVVELDGDVLSPGEGAERPLAEGSVVAVFRIVTGG